MLTVITGAPCSGKSTYARQHARADDVVIDFDVLAQALGSPASHGHSAHMAEVALAAWRAAIAEAIEQHRRGCRVWVVDTEPTPYRLKQYYEARAEVVTLAADRGELYRRAGAERPPSWRGRIDRYLDARREPAPLARTAWLWQPTTSKFW